jgi:predicted nuclease with TOPRIM domain
LAQGREALQEETKLREATQLEAKEVEKKMRSAVEENNLLKFHNNRITKKVEALQRRFKEVRLPHTHTHTLSLLPTREHASPYADIARTYCRRSKRRRRAWDGSVLAPRWSWPRRRKSCRLSRRTWKAR